MLCCSGVVWDKEKNVVHTTAENWTKWAMEYPPSTAYYYGGDPLYDELCHLFAPENQAHEEPEIPAEAVEANVVVENQLPAENLVQNNEIIIISDDDNVDEPLPLPAIAEDNIVDISSDEEVVPILNFHDDAYESLEYDSSDEDEGLPDSPSMNVNGMGEVVDHHPLSSRYESVIPEWVAPPTRGFLNRYNFDYVSSGDESSSSDDSSSSTRTLNSRRY